MPWRVVQALGRGYVQTRHESMRPAGQLSSSWRHLRQFNNIFADMHGMWPSSSAPQWLQTGQNVIDKQHSADVDCKALCCAVTRTCVTATWPTTLTSSWRRTFSSDVCASGLWPTCIPAAMHRLDSGPEQDAAMCKPAMNLPHIAVCVAHAPAMPNRRRHVTSLLGTPAALLLPAC